MDLLHIKSDVCGYAATFEPGLSSAILKPDPEYAEQQPEFNRDRTREFLAPLLTSLGARTVVDVGCGVGAMVCELAQQGFAAYGVDVAEVVPHWIELKRPRDAFFVTDPGSFRLPFCTESVDAVFSFGVIEHVGTADGHAMRLPEYRSVRRDWVREVFRCIRPGGYAVLGGPNRQFPVDAAHGPDSHASPLERWLSRKLGLTVHKTWGEGFLWSYGDFHEYLRGLPYTLTPLRVDQYVGLSRVPRSLRRFVRLYLRALPRPLLGTGLNPWALALIRKECTDPETSTPGA